MDFNLAFWRWIHIHRDPNYVCIGANVYYQCRCGARRVKRAYINLDGPVQPNWPLLVDRHGFPTNDSGWVKDKEKV